MEKILLEIELVPSSVWYSNLRSFLLPKDWKVLQKNTFIKANYCCEICSGKGKKHPVECHEIWHYDDINCIQILKGLIALCPLCHEVKHFGLAGLRGRTEIAKKHLMIINNWNIEETNKHIQKSFSLFEKRSKFEWDINIDFLKK